MDFDHDKQNHSCLLVKDVADRKKEALKTNVHALEREQNKQSEALQAVKKVTECLKVNVELAKDEVSRHKQEVLDDFTKKLEQNFQEIINELDQKYNEGYDSLAKQSVAMKLQLDKVKSSLDFSKNLLERGSQEDILSSQAMIQQTVETLEKERTQPIKPVHDGDIKYKRKPIQNENSMFANLLGQVGKIECKDHVTRGNFPRNLQRNGVALQVARKTSSCDTPCLQLVSQQKIALQVAEKVEAASTFRNATRQVTACDTRKRGRIV